MLKDNHLAALREQLGQHLTLAQLTAAIRGKLDPAITLWLEVDTLEQLAEALQPGGAPISSSSTILIPIKCAKRCNFATRRR